MPDQKDKLLAALTRSTSAQRAMTRAMLAQAEAVQALADSVNALAQGVGQMVVLGQDEVEGGEADDGAKYVQLLDGTRIKVS